jgi:hypothetical protein
MNLAALLIAYFVLIGPSSGQLTDDCRITWQSTDDLDVHGGNNWIAQVACPGETRNYRFQRRWTCTKYDGTGECGWKFSAAPSLKSLKTGVL